MSYYQQMIRETMARAGCTDAPDPRHVEAWMRLEHGCLDGLSPAQFSEEMGIAIECIAAGPAAVSESLAQSLGF